MWSLHPPFNLLATFGFPAGIVPSTLAVEAAERSFYVGSVQGNVYHVPLYRRRGDVGDLGDELEAVGGGGQGAPPIKSDGSVISYK